MWRQVKAFFSRLAQRGPAMSRNASDEIASMGERELCDLGIGAGEVPYVLAGGGRGRDSSAAVQPAGVRAGMEQSGDATPAPPSPEIKRPADRPMPSDSPHEVY